MLKADGLIELLPRRGAVVKRISMKEILQISDIRLSIEPLILKWAIPNMTNEALEEARLKNKLYMEIDDPLQRIRLNREFHLAIYKRADSKRLYNIIDSLFNGIMLIGHWNVITKVDNSSAIEEHDEIIKACESMDVEFGINVLQKHISHSKMRLNTIKEL